MKSDVCGVFLLDIIFNVYLLQEMIEEADRDGDKMIDREEFFRVMKKKGDNPLDDLDTE